LIKPLFLNNDFVKFVNKGKKICIIWGKEKLRLKLIEGTYYVEFIDDALLDNIPCDTGGIKHLFFYSDKNTVKLIAKQAHLIIQHLENYYSGVEISKLLNKSTLQDPSYIDLVNKICYKKLHGKIFSVGKSSSKLYPKKWQWFGSDTSTQQFKIWNGAVIDLRKSVSLNFKTKFDPGARNMTFCPFGNRYAIKKIKN
jgi:hypothetical protein